MYKQREYQKLLQEAIDRVNNNEITTIDELYRQLVNQLNQKIEPFEREKKKVHF